MCLQINTKKAKANQIKTDYINARNYFFTLTNNFFD